MPPLSSPAGELYALVEKMYPICRSITGNGVRETLRILQQDLPLTIHEVPSGTQVFDWKVPDEWNITDAYIKNQAGEKLVDFKKHNLHVLNYSIPVEKSLPLAELKQHLFSLPDYPEWIPYRTSYHNANWGFCVTHSLLTQLKDEVYDIKIESSLQPGYLTYGEYFIKGQLDEEVVFTSHICHPSLCNDNLSGIAIAAHLAAVLSNRNNKYSYRFLFIPGTIGSITWLSLNPEKIHRIKHGLVLTLLGDASSFHYKKSRRGDAAIDRVVTRVLQRLHPDHAIINFYPYGYDERQFCSPAFNLPFGRLSRKPHGEFPEYHTSADNLDFVKPERLAQSLDLLLQIVDELEFAETYFNLKPACEPQLGKRGLFKQIGGEHNAKDFQMALLWVLNLSDGDYSLADIIERSGLEEGVIRQAVASLLETDLLKKV